MNQKKSISEKINTIMMKESHLNKSNQQLTKNDSISKITNKLKAKSVISHSNLMSNVEFGIEDDLFSEDEELNKTKTEKFTFNLFYSAFRQMGKTFLDSIFFIIVMLIITIYVLFISDIQSGFIPIQLDELLNKIDLIILSLYLFEFVLGILCLDNYNFSFYFWLDLISTFSLIIEIDGVMDSILHILLNEDDITNGTGNTAARFSKATKTWKVTRIVRVVRVVRLIRIVKLYKTAMNAKRQLEEKKRKIIIEEAKKQEEIQKEKEREVRFSYKSKKINDNFILNRKRKALRDKGKKFNKVNNMKNNFLQAREERQVEIMKMKENNLIEEFENEKGELELIEKLNDNEEKEEKEEKYQKINEDKEEKEESLSDLLKDGASKESNITKIVSQSITKKVIILILGMIVVLPLLDEGLYISNDDNYFHISIANYYEGFMSIRNNSLQFNNISDESIYNKNIILLKTKLLSLVENFPIINITYNEYNDYSSEGFIFFQNSSFENVTFRQSEIRNIFSSNLTVSLIYSKKAEIQLSSILEIIKTVLIGMLIVYAAVVLENDTKKLVLGPMETIIEIIDLVTTDPIKAKNPENFNFGLKNLVNAIEENERGDEKEAKNIKIKNQHMEKYEVVKVKESIIKISNLLVLGLGDLGCDIIKTNLKQNKMIDFFTKSKKIKGIYGISVIPNCNVLNTLLKERSILYINKIYNIVHSAIDRFGGSINSNYDNHTFFNWTFRTLREYKQSKLYSKDIRQMGDLALCSIFEAILSIKKSKSLLEFKNDPLIIGQYGKNYHPQIGFILHCGVAYEGIIGSNSKIEASYLSWNIIVLRRMRELLVQYGVEILITDSFVSQLSDEMKEICRMIDIIQYKDQRTYIKVYTIDLNSHLSFNQHGHEEENKINHIVKKERYRKFLTGYETGKTQKISTFAFSKQGYKELLSTTKPVDFFRVFDKGINDYLAGDWKSAKLNFDQCFIYDNTDNPSKFLYNYMKKFKFKAPRKNENCWIGKREI